MRFWLSTLIVLVICLRSDQAAGAEPDMTPVRQWIEHAKAVKSVVVDFTQERHLRAVSKPLVSMGRMWYKAPGALRWQAGDPPKMIALQQTRGGDFTVLEPKKREARIFSAAALKEKGGPLAFIEAGFPTSLESFEKTFRVDEVSRDDGRVEISGRLNDRRLSVAVLKIVFVIESPAQRLRSLEIWFRDGSKIVNRFSKVTEDAEVADSLFAESLDGWKVIRE